jgi:hypothetical protein
MYRDRTNEMHQYVEELNKTFQGTYVEAHIAHHRSH